MRIVKKVEFRCGVLINRNPRLYGAGGRSRTATDVSPLPPQGSVSTNFTTSAFFINNYSAGIAGLSVLSVETGNAGLSSAGA